MSDNMRSVNNINISLNQDPPATATPAAAPNPNPSPVVFKPELDAEITARQAGDTNLQNQINAEAAARTTADQSLQSQITSGQNNLQAETAARQAADANLQDQINAETAARTTADQNLQSQITAGQNNLQAETVARQVADTNLQDEIDGLDVGLGSLANTLNQETISRQAADTNLQNLINAVPIKEFKFNSRQQVLNLPGNQNNPFNIPVTVNITNTQEKVLVVGSFEWSTSAQPDSIGVTCGGRFFRDVGAVGNQLYTITFMFVDTNFSTTGPKTYDIEAHSIGNTNLAAEKITLAAIRFA